MILAEPIIAIDLAHNSIVINAVVDAVASGKIVVHELEIQKNIERRNCVFNNILNDGIVCSTKS